MHFPAGAVAKDGPSAGVTLVTAITSLLTNNRVRQFTAMTGEISLRGLVLPVGGIKEKLLAARFGGIKRVIVPEQNKRDVDNKLSKGLQVIYAKTIWDVLDGALQTENIHLPIAHL